MVIITIEQWMDKTIPAYEAHGAFWGMVGGTSDSAKIVRCDKWKTIQYEQQSIDEYETIQFRSGHKVYITNSTGQSCDIVVSTPVAIECVIGEYSLSLFAWKYEDGAVFIQGEYWALTAVDRSDYAYISRVSASNKILETIKLAPCKVYRFSTGHEVYITNLVAGWTPNCRITVYPLIDPCEGITCPDFCDYENHIKYFNGRCVDGECIYDTIENSEECGYIPPEEPPIDDEIEPPSDLTKLILPIGIGIGLLLLSKK